MVNIYKIDWLSKNAKEAEVYLSDGNFHLVCFSHPFNYIMGDTAPLPLYALNAKNIHSLADDNDVFSIEQVSSSFEYKISGRVVNKDCNQIKVGEFIIELDIAFPNDVQTDSFVSFLCDRIDLY
ncbi:MAG: hypothetical protein Q4G16_06380 [Cruoricaptor ignavus]|nr:hypothetical protein [Cruoricaptor ignavus]